MRNLLASQFNCHICNVPFKEADPTVRNILLIGASQNGKSALGNFLVTAKALDNFPVFGIGDGTVSCTTKWKAERTQWTYNYLSLEVLNQSQIHTNPKEAKKFEKQQLCTFQIIDTPGIGDVNVDKEAENMEHVYEELREMKNRQQELALALLVVKYPPFLSEELKANINFYKKMLPDIWNLNVYLVITNVENNEAWLKKQTKGGQKDPRTIVKKIQKEIQSWLEKSYDIPMVTIDSLFDSDSPEEKSAVQVRELLLATCVNSPSISLNGMRLPKTKRMLEEDKRNIRELQGKKDGIKEGIILIEETLSETADKIAALSVQKEATASQLNQCKEEYEDKNGGKLVVIYSNRFTNELQLFSYSKQTFDVKTDFPIRDKIVARGTAVYEIDDDKHVKGMVYESIWKNLDCTLTLSTYSCYYYEKQITDLRVRISTLKAELESVTREFDDKSGDERDFKAQLEAYRKQLVDIDKQIEDLKLEYIIL